MSAAASRAGEPNRTIASALVIDYQCKHAAPALSSILTGATGTLMQMDSSQTLAERVQFVLDQSAMTPAFVASKIGCSREAIQQWLSGSTSNIKNELLFAFADLTGYEARWIATGQGPRKSEYRRDSRFPQVLATMEKLPPDAYATWIKIGDTLSEQGTGSPEPKTEPTGHGRARKTG